ncbi:MAG TPA: hypothetical protein VMY38_00595 [Gemmatimonadaceae bacterium]|nr:hypothetical protein [Gemmatimonadaceae bacterium]
MKTHSIAKAFGLVLALAGAANAQDRNTIRPLGPVTARSVEPVNVGGLRPVANGVLVNDPRRRRVLLFDASLSTFTVVADSTPETGNAYGGRFGGLFAYRGDSSLFTDPQSLSMLVIDPAGKIARVMSVPSTRDAGMMSGAMGGATYDGRGGLVYRSMPRPQMRRPEPGGAFTPPDIPDSAAILRIDLATREVDTLGFIKTPKLSLDVQRDEQGRMSIQSKINPLPVIDEWAALPDGTIAFVRGRDYHIDWLGADGSATSSAKIAFDWQRLTDDDKVAFIDSLKVARARMGEGAPGAIAAVGAAMGVSEGAMSASPNVQIFMGGPGGGPGGGGGAGGGRREGAAGAGGAPRANAQVMFVEPSELPDYKPAFFAGSVRVDTEGNLWIRTIPTKAIPGGPVYDVIDRTGKLVERVQVPVGRTIAGFGPGGVVYLIAQGTPDTHLEKASIR